MNKEGIGVRSHSDGGFWNDLVETIPWTHTWYTASAFVYTLTVCPKERPLKSVRGDVLVSLPRVDGGDHRKQDLRCRLKPVYIPIFSVNSNT